MRTLIITKKAKRTNLGGFHRGPDGYTMYRKPKDIRQCRGHEFDLIVIVDNVTEEEYYQCLRPMVSTTKGQILYANDNRGNN